MNLTASRRGSAQDPRGSKGQQSRLLNRDQQAEARRCDRGIDSQATAAGVPAGAIVDCLTAGEHEILRRIADGESNAQIAAAIGLSTRTVETYRLRLMKKLGVHTVAALVKFSIRYGITSLD